jgi:uncharacterized 2Fe-2S/4Fe-4S cluster protein (DUF4445 family)
MRDAEVLVRFSECVAAAPSPNDILAGEHCETYVLPGTRLMEAAIEAGIALEAPCGGEGICGKCRLQVLAGAAQPTQAERDCFSSEELRLGWRLACQTVVENPADVLVPTASLTSAEQKILAHSSSGTPSGSDDPPTAKRYVEMPPPARGDDLPDLLRLERELDLGPLTADFDLLPELGAKLRRMGFRGTAVVSRGRLLDFEAGDTTAENFAAAVDLGTTTLVAELISLDGRRLAVAAGLNPQTAFGDDVLSRILLARDNPDGLKRLRDVVFAAIERLLGELCATAGISPKRIYQLTVAGNTTMQQIFCGLDPGPLGEVPFTPAVGGSLSLPARQLGLQNTHPAAEVFVMPVIGGFVGGDTAAGLLATELSEADGPGLFIDIGTNGEIALAADGRLTAASTAAGPAFEGARISRGMRGAAGAIEKVVFDGRLRIGVIGDVPPAGICGSGLIDAAAELLRYGLMTTSGRLLSPDKLPAHAPSALAQQLVLLEDGQTAFMLASAEDAADGRPILLTQRDLRELQLAAGAIRAGIAILLRRAGLSPGDLQRVLIGGGFGNFIRRRNAQRIGLLPPEVKRSNIRYMGNTSLAGARLAAVSLAARTRADVLARRTEHVDLSTDADFARALAEAMIFPEC